jgi:hypothetical protein
MGAREIENTSMNQDVVAYFVHVWESGGKPVFHQVVQLDWQDQFTAIPTTLALIHRLEMMGYEKLPPRASRKAVRHLGLSKTLKMVDRRMRSEYGWFTSRTTTVWVTKAEDQRPPDQR